MRAIRLFGATLRLLLAIVVLPLRFVGAVLRGFGLLSGSPVAIIATAASRRPRS